LHSANWIEEIIRIHLDLFANALKKKILTGFFHLVFFSIFIFEQEECARQKDEQANFFLIFQLLAKASYHNFALRKLFANFSSFILYYSMP
jgi:hypothetical protein